MDFNYYQEQTHKTAIYPTDARALVYLVLGLASEAGEVAGLLKKLIRDGGTLNREDLIHELGDNLWYISEICTELGISMEEVAQANLEKLGSRKLRDTLGGSGDDR